jgi:predicted MFS family arabinose efflux permease
MGTALSLGFGRFAFALFIPSMSQDLGWTYFVAGFMNSGMALGYLIGAVSVPAVVHRFGAPSTFVGSGLLTVALLGLSGVGANSGGFLALRVLAGITCGYIFSAGGLLVAQVAAVHPRRSGWLVGVYYAGVGVGIIAASLAVPPLIHLAERLGQPHPWQWAWFAIAALAAITLALMWRAALLAPPVPERSHGERTSVRRYLPMLLGYFCFGLGYIGYMTFVIALLKTMGLDARQIIVFYALLGLMVLVSPFVWARTLTHTQGGGVLCLLNSLLAVACAVPAVVALIGDPSIGSAGIAVILAVFASGMVFGACFMATVASTTAFVRHNLPAREWVSGISAFTSLFAVGQLVGPSMAGFISDRVGSLAGGLLFAAVVLAIGAIVAARQRPLADHLVAH